MKSFAALAVVQMALTGMEPLVQAQTPIVTLNIYSDNKCGSDPNNLDSSSFALDSFEKAGEIRLENGKPVDYCNKATIGLVNPNLTSTGDYIVYPDAGNLPDGCDMAFYNLPPDQEEVDPQYACSTLYRVLKSNEVCPQLNLSPQFGFMYCCGDACKPLSGKRSLPEPEVRDVTQVKRAPVAARPQQRDLPSGCKYTPDAGWETPKIHYGEQENVAGVAACSETDGCPFNQQISYSSSESNTFGASVEAGGEIMKLLSLSVTFSYEHTEEQTTQFQTQYGTSIPYGGEGYISFRPKLECTQGKFDATTCGDANAKSGMACWPVTIGNGNKNADGYWSFVQTK